MVSQWVSGWFIQGHPERMTKVNHVEKVFIFTNILFSYLFLEEK